MKIKAIMILTWTTFLISCKNQKMICSELKTLEVDPVIMYDISFQFNRCRARCFDLNKWETLPFKKCAEKYSINEEITQESINLELEKCDGVSGFDLDAIKEIRPRIKRLNNLKEDICN